MGARDMTVFFVSLAVSAVFGLWEMCSSRTAAEQ
jgi:hypothetical protein